MDEIELLFTEALGCDRLSLYLNRNRRLDKNTACFISGALKRRISGEPIQYILGKTEFMGLEFKVEKNVFIPRMETELLVETAIHQLSVKKILDIGTGSGCIAVSLAKFLPNIEIDALDISYAAIKVARENARLNNVDDKINFIQSDLFDTYYLRAGTYGLIVSNPPYVPAEDINNLSIEVRSEPKISLNGGTDGLDFYRRLISGSAKFLKKGGLLILEIGFKQRKAIENLFQNSKNFEIIEVVKDYAGIDRVVVARVEK
jgi:release factor glutamine methyltransferase